MRIILGAVLIALSTMASAICYCPFLDSSENAVYRRLSQEEKIDQAKLINKNSAIILLNLHFTNLIRSSALIIDPQEVSFREGLEGFSKPNEKVWIVGTKNRTTSFENLYLVNLSTEKIILLCTNKSGLLRECS